MSFLLTAVGLAMLLLGGTSLVRGASQIALSLNISPIIIGLTVVAFGTSTPELVVNITGALKGQTDLAFGNAVGSNLANFGLVLGVAALMSPIYLQGQVVRREVPFLLLVTAILLVMAWDLPLTGQQPLLDRADAIILFLLFTIFVYFIARDMALESGDPLAKEVTAFSPRQTGNRARTVAINLTLVAIGISFLVFGGNLTIEHGSDVARILNVSDVAIGMFVVAVGTSLPELATSAIAAYKRETDLALGNIVGSNIFNTLVVLPAAAFINPLPIPEGGDLDLGVGFIFVLVVIPLFVFSNARLGRKAGAGLVLAYLAYMAYRVTL